ITPSVAEQEGQQTETEATGAPQKHHYTLNQQVGSITVITWLISVRMFFVTINCQMDKKDRHVTVSVVLSGTNAFSKESKIITSRCPAVNIRRC
ncbi:hypothetical protein M2632_27005, partial [Klebsiella pneumoniae]|nr:hypothetical protein [Klebsiella pneumoniae]